MEADDLNALLQDQKRVATNIHNFTAVVNSPATEEYAAQAYEVRLDLLESYWKEFCQRDRLLQRHAESLSERSYFSSNLYSSVETIYVTVKSWMTSQLQRLRIGDQQAPVGTSSQANIVMAAPHTALESVKLPSFSGSQRDWEPFKEKFISLVLNDSTMSPIIKYQRLLNALEGEAAETLHGTKIVGANFLSAWNTLCERYDNKPLRFSLQMKTLINLPSASKENSSHINQLLNTVNESINNFKDLGRPVHHWDDILIFFLESKLPSMTQMDWVKTVERDKLGDFPKYDHLKKFLQDRVRTLELVDAKSDCLSSEQSKNSNSISKMPGASQKQEKQRKRSQVFTLSKNGKSKPSAQCSYCKGAHFIAYCFKFTHISLENRKAFVNTTKLCFNCLNSHSLDSCTSKKRCFLCGKKHHTKLHPEQQPSSQLHDVTPSTSTSTMAISRSSQALSASVGRRTALSTARVVIEGPLGHRLEVRALLDSGSEESFITSHIARLLRLPLQRAEITCSGLADSTVSISRQASKALLKSNVCSDFSLEFSPFVLKKLTSNSPREELSLGKYSHLGNLQLADPDFNLSKPIDCILSSAIFSAALLHRILKGSTSQPTALESVFGWIVLGAEDTQSSTTPPRTILHTISEDEASTLQKTLSKFWELEEVPETPLWSPEESLCHAHFKKTHHRNQDGRFVLRLPFARTPELPDTFQAASSCLTRVLKKFERQPELAKAYIAFMDEYRELCHMELVQDHEVNANHVCYIPHHPVFRKDTGKIRVVFNASQGYSNGSSLNSFLHVGPKLQEDVLVIMLRWSLFQYVFTCDVVKMFRQFLIHPADRDWQRILWRSSQSEPLRHFRLTTVSYGEACAPFQSNACMLQLADDEQDSYPRGAEAIRKGRYADDFYVGHDSISELLETRNQLIRILSSAGMDVGKWAANKFQLLQNIQSDARKGDTAVVQDPEAISTLGLRWNPVGDYFHFRCAETQITDRITKRTILSEISKLYDPVGYLSAVTIRAKILLQNLWLLKLGWDEGVPQEIADAWIEFRSQFVLLENIHIPRWLGTSKKVQIQIHGFCDASERAYAAVLFVVFKNERFCSRFLTAKSKVAPVKAISLPRLELCGAHLLSRMLSYILPKLDHTPCQIFCWSDSTIVLAWLQSHASRWKAFIANRVSAISNAIPTAIWKHVPSSENPADLASRGVSPSTLKDSTLWWEGPAWLRQPQSSWPSTVENFHTDLEARSKPTHVFASQTVSNEFVQWTTRFSSMEKIIRILAYVWRWRSNSRLEISKRRFSWLSAEELRFARMSLFKGIQRVEFSLEIQALSSGKRLSQSSSILRLVPFLDPLGILRVGGRLQNSFLTEEEKHPIILSAKTHIVQLLITSAHRETLHGGPSLVQSYLSRQFWIIHGRSAIRSIIRKCPTCIRDEGVTVQQQMGPLPEVRTRVARPFTSTGVDYTGPFLIKWSPGRGQKVVKAYIAIFVCMVVRAVHIEVVSDLTSVAFLAAFRRFVSRRGLPQTMYSDNGTNFQGASSELRRLFAETSRFSQEIAEKIARDGVKWSFIPPRAPNFGGLWESNVRSFKRHLRRVIGETRLSFEEFSTVAAMIEACLNSRPLSAISTHEKDLFALTPGHFLIGAALVSAPEPFIATNEQSSVCSRWHLLILMRNHFWKRWQSEFLAQMQQRSKWLYPNRDFKTGDLVLFKDELLPASKWPLARITKLHLGKDGLCRVVSLRSGTHEFTRPVNKLIWLPMNEEALQFENRSRAATAGGSESSTSASASG